MWVPTKHLSPLRQMPVKPRRGEAAVGEGAHGEPAYMPQDLDGTNLVAVSGPSPEAIWIGRLKEPQDSGWHRLQAWGGQVLRHAGRGGGR